MNETAIEAAPNAITSRLAPGETLIWWDRPIPKVLAARELAQGYVFSLLFLGFGITWTVMASRQNGAFGLFGVPFVAAGSWLVSSPLRAYLRAPKMPFALTDMRAIVLSGSTLKSFPLDQVAFVETPSYGGTGDVLFHHETNAMGYWMNRGSPAFVKSGFLAVKEPERVGSAFLAAMEMRKVRMVPGAVVRSST